MTSNKKETSQIKLYKYVQMDHFFQMIRTKQLHVNTAASFQDGWEGFAGWVNSELKASLAGEASLGGNDSDGLKKLVQEVEEAKNEHFVDCWNQQDRECIAMWKLYGSSKSGVMIETNADELKRVYQNHHGQFDTMAISCQEVQYLSPEQKCCTSCDSSSTDCIFEFEPRKENFAASKLGCYLTQKNYPFDFENEVRVIARDYAKKEGTDHMKVDFDAAFIKKIILGPNVPDYMKDIIERFLKDSGLGDLPVELSVLSLIDSARA